MVFYSPDCSSCKETLEAVDALVAKNYPAKVLLVDMDALLTDTPSQAQQLLDTFDLSAMPFVIQLDKKGVVQHRYVSLSF